MDVVFESIGGTAGGTAPTISEAVNMVRSGGTVLALGVFTTDAPVPARRLVNQEITLLCSVVYGHHSGRPEFATAVAKLARYLPWLERLQSAMYRLDDANAAFEHALDKRRGAVKVSIEVPA